MMPLESNSWVACSSVKACCTPPYISRLRRASSPRVCAALASGNMAVVVLLVNGAGDFGYVHNRNAVKQRVFDQPLIEPRATKN